MSKISKLDEKAIKLLEIVKNKKEEISKLSKPTYKTNMTFFEPHFGRSINLNVYNNVDELIKLFAFIKSQVTKFKDAAKELGVEDFDTKFEGFSLEDWKEDFITKINVINIRNLKADLKIKEDALNKLVSEEKRKELELELLERELLK